VVKYLLRYFISLYEDVVVDHFDFVASACLGKIIISMSSFGKDLIVGGFFR